MENIEKEINKETEEKDNYGELLNRYDKLQKETISIEKYNQEREKLLKENSQLLGALEKNQSVNVDSPEYQRTTNEDKLQNAEKVIREYKPGGSFVNDTNLLEAMLDQREITLQATGKDIMVGESYSGNEGIIKPADAEEIARDLRKLIKIAKENNISIETANNFHKIIK